MSLLTKGLPTVNNSPVVGRDGTDDDVSSTVGNPGSPQISGRKKKNDTSDKPKKKKPRDVISPKTSRSKKIIDTKKNISSKHKSTPTDKSSKESADKSSKQSADKPSKEPHERAKYNVQDERRIVLAERRALPVGKPLERRAVPIGGPAIRPDMRMVTTDFWNNDGDISQGNSPLRNYNDGGGKNDDGRDNNSDNEDRVNSKHGDKFRDVPDGGSNDDNLGYDAFPGPRPDTDEWDRNNVGDRNNVSPGRDGNNVSPGRDGDNVSPGRDGNNVSPGRDGNDRNNDKFSNNERKNNNHRYPDDGRNKNDNRNNDKFPNNERSNRNNDRDNIFSNDERNKFPNDGRRNRNDKYPNGEKNRFPSNERNKFPNDEKSRNPIDEFERYRRGGSHTNKSTRERDDYDTPNYSKSVMAGKSVGNALKENIGNFIATSIADHIMNMTGDRYRISRNNNFHYKNDDFDSDEEILSTKHENRINKDIRSGRRVAGEIYGPFSKKRKGVMQHVNTEGCPAKLTLWLKSVKSVLMEFSNTLAKMLLDGRKSMATMYERDVLNAVDQVMLRQKLFDNPSPLARGLARFSMHASLNQTERPAILDSAISTEFSFEQRGHQTNESLLYRSSVHALFYPYYVSILHKLPHFMAASVFNDVIKYVKASQKVYQDTYELPGLPFRDLLVDINMKIIEDQAKSANNESLDYIDSNYGTAQLRSVKSDTHKTMIAALNKMKNIKPISSDLHTRLDKPRDLLMLQPSGVLTVLPVPISSMLKLVDSLNALLFLETRGVVTNGFFKSVCVVVTQQFVTGSKKNEPLIRPSAIAAEAARDSLLRLSILSNKKDGKGDGIVGHRNVRYDADGRKNISGDGRYDAYGKKITSTYDANGKRITSGRYRHIKYDTEEAMSTGEYSSEGEDSEEDLDKKYDRRIEQKKIVPKDGFSNQDDLSRLSDVLHTSGGIFLDKSDFGNKIREYINSNDGSGLMHFAADLLHTDHKVAIYRLVSSLVEALLLTNEKCRDLNQEFGKKVETGLDPVIDGKNIVNMLTDPDADRDRITNLFLTTEEPEASLKHEAFVLSSSLIPSNDVNDIEKVVLSFFKSKIKKTSIEPDQDDGCTRIYPDLLSFSKVILNQTSESIANMLSRIMQNTKDIDSFLTGTKLEQLTSPSGPSLKLAQRIDSILMFAVDERIRMVVSPFLLEHATDGITLARFVSSVNESAAVKQLYLNARQLDADTALTIMMFPPEQQGTPCNGCSKDVILLSRLAKGFFAIAEGAVAVVGNPDQEKNNTKKTYSLVIDSVTLDRAVDLAAHILDSSTARVFRSDENMQPSRLLDGFRSLEGSLDQYVDRKDGKISEDCVTTTLTKWAVRGLSETYLKQINKNSKAFTNHAVKDSAVIASDNALVSQISKRAVNLVKGQLSYAMGLAVLISASIKIIEADVRYTEARSMNGQTTSSADFMGSAKHIRSKKGIIRNTSHLAIVVAVGAAAGMTKLSNEHFFEMVQQANQRIVNSIGVDIENNPKILSVENLRDDHNRLTEGKKPKISNFGDISGEWMHNAINSITQGPVRRDGRGGEYGTLSGARGDESVVGIMSKLRDMTK
nr:wsv271-like protein [Chionoecetes opilio bacilliform virus]